MGETWEKVIEGKGPFGEYTERLKVPGGWLYRCGRWSEHANESKQILTLVMVFVPVAD